MIVLSYFQYLFALLTFSLLVHASVGATNSNESSTEDAYLPPSEYEDFYKLKIILISDREFDDIEKRFEIISIAQKKYFNKVKTKLVIIAYDSVQLSNDRQYFSLSYHIRRKWMDNVRYDFGIFVSSKEFANKNRTEKSECGVSYIELSVGSNWEVEENALYMAMQMGYVPGEDKLSIAETDKCITKDFPYEVYSYYFMNGFCGNGIADREEQCDYQTFGYRKNDSYIIYSQQACINCTLQGDAECLNEACCNSNTFKIMPAGTMCRKSFSKCDTPEYCDGVSKFCPQDAMIDECINNRNSSNSLTNSRDNNNCGAEEDVSFVDYPLEEVTVLPNKTTYHCVVINFDSTIYVIGVQLVSENKALHHWLLSLCTNQSMMDDKSKEQEDNCKNNMHRQCNQMISAWSVGLEPIDCLPHDTNLEMGPDGIRSAFLQVHYFHQDSTTLHETSKLRLYTIKNKRKYIPGIVMVGNLYLEIPPRAPRHEEKLILSSKCSRYLLKQKIYITSLWLHMHMAGSGGKLTVNGRRGFRKLAETTRYSYWKQHEYRYKEAIPFDRGDIMQLICTYNNSQSNHTLYFGYGLQQEMCLALIRYYPKEAIRSPKLPYFFGDIDLCEGHAEEKNLINGSMTYFAGCNVTEFIEEVYRPNLINFHNHCEPGLAYCSDQCRQVLKTLLHHSCMHGQAYQYIVYAGKSFHYYEEFEDIQSRMLACMKIYGQYYL